MTHALATIAFAVVAVAALASIIHDIERNPLWMLDGKPDGERRGVPDTARGYGYSQSQQSTPVADDLDDECPF